MTAGQEALDRQVLEDRRAFLLRSLADLDAERAAGDLDEDDYVALRDHYTARAAAILRRLDAAEATGRGADDSGHADGSGHAGRSAQARGAPVGRNRVARGLADPADHDVGRAAGDAARPAVAGGRAERRRRRSAAIVAGVLAFGALVGWGVARATAPSVPGETITGSQANAQADELIQAQKLQAKGDDVGALKLYGKVLAADPEQPEALTYEGWLLAQAGYTNQALSDFARAEAADPSYSDVHVYRGIVLLDAKNDPSGAITEFRYYLNHHPDPQLRSVVEKAIQRAQKEVAKQHGQ